MSVTGAQKRDEPHWCVAIYGKTNESRENLVAAMLPSGMEVSYYTSGFIRS